MMDVDLAEKDFNDNVKMVNGKMEQLEVRTTTIEGQLDKLGGTMAETVAHRVLAAEMDEVMRINVNAVVKKDGQDQLDLSVNSLKDEFREKLQVMDKRLSQSVGTLRELQMKLEKFGDGFNDNVKMVNDNMEQMEVRTTTIEGQLDKLGGTMAETVTHGVLVAAMDEVTRINMNALVKKDSQDQFDLSVDSLKDEFREKWHDMDKRLSQSVATSRELQMKVQKFGDGFLQMATTVKNDQETMASTIVQVSSTCMTKMKDSEEKLAGLQKNLPLQIKSIANDIWKSKANIFFEQVEARMERELCRTREMVMEVLQDPGKFLDEDSGGSDEL